MHCVDPEDERLRAIMDVTFHHHAMALATAMEFLALEWRSAEIARQVDAMDGLGEPARRLDEVYAALKTMRYAIAYRCRARNRAPRLDGGAAGTLSAGERVGRPIKRDARGGN